MIRQAGVLMSLIILTCANSSDAGGKFNKKIKIGDPVPIFANLPGVDGKTHSLIDLKGKEVVVLVVTCNHCPIATAYEDRLIDFTKKYAGPDGRTALVAINVSHEEEDRFPQMVVRAKEKHFNFPYLYDESQKIGRASGATVTPEFFVLNKDRKVVYMGAMDDGVNPKNVTVNYLVPAVEAALKGTTPTVSETAARGCNIIYEKAKN